MTSDSKYSAASRKQKSADREQQGRSSSDWLALTTIVIVVATIAFAASAYGAVEPWSELPLVLSSVLLTGLTAVQVGQRGIQRMIFPLAILAFFGLLIAFSLIPLSASFVEVLSPHRLSTFSELLNESPEQLTLSYYPSVTKHGLKLFLMGTAVFAAIATNLTRRRHVEWLLLGLFGLGVAESLLALAQTFTGAEGVYWSDLTFGDVRAGSFINYSNFSQFLNLTAGAGLGLLLIRLRKKEQTHSWGHDGFSALFRQHGWLLMGLTLHAVAIASSMSRNGVIAMAVAGGLVAFLLGRRQDLGWHVWSLVALPPLVFGGLVLVGFDAFYDRLGTLEDQSSYTDRWELSMATVRVALDHPLFGTGLDTHAYVFPAYDSTGSIALAQQADNDYAQLAEETGLFGIAAVLAFLGVLIAAAWHRLTSGHDSVSYALYGVAYGLIAVGVQSLTDFGQRLPAVFCVSAALCGIVVAITANMNHRHRKQKQPSLPSSSPMVGRCLAVALALVAIPVGWWASNETLRDFRAEQWWSLAYDSEQQIQQSDTAHDLQDYADLVAAAETASDLQPKNVEYAFWLNAYRWQMLLHSCGNDWVTALASPEVGGYARQIADSLSETRRLCPTYGLAYTLEGQVRLAIGDATGARLVRLGAQLAPNDPEAVLAVAEVEAAAGEDHESEARQALQRVVALDSSRFQEACHIFVETLERPEWAHDLAGKDIGRLNHLAKLLNQHEAYQELRAQLADEAAVLREEKVLNGDARAGDIVAVARQRVATGDLEAAVQLYRKALATNYNNIGWRLALSDTLVQLERYEEAFREARTCLRIRPGHTRARQQLEKISLLIPAPGSEPKAK